MFGLLGDREISKTFFMPINLQMVCLVFLEAVAVKDMMWSSGSRLDTSPKLANSRRKDSPLRINRKINIDKELSWLRCLMQLTAS